MVKEEVFKLLEEVLDPEVPVLSVVDLGIVRDAEMVDGKLLVTVTPTYSGCQAIKVIEDGIRDKLHEGGYENAEIKTVYAPPWTTEWISEEGKRKLKEYGIAPPEKTAEDTLVQLPPRPEHIPCPFCDSKDTELKSEFGSTACKSMHYCNGCHQPFEHFKAF